LDVDARKVNAVTELEVYEAALRPSKFPHGYFFATLLGLAALGAVVFAVERWSQYERERMYRGFETGLARICIENAGAYSPGKCDPAPVQFQMVPLPGFALPNQTPAERDDIDL
jgi:hypothetical protein